MLIGWGGGSASQADVPWTGTSGNSGSTPVKYSTDPDRSDGASKNSLDAAAVIGALRAASALLVDPLLSLASSMWKDGECLQRVPRPGWPAGAPIRASVHIDATLLEHRQTDERLDSPITVTGAGVSSLRPEVGKAAFGVDLRLETRAGSCHALRNRRHGHLRSAVRAGVESAKLSTWSLTT